MQTLTVMSIKLLPPEREYEQDKVTVQQLKHTRSQTQRSAD